MVQERTFFRLAFLGLLLQCLPDSVASFRPSNGRRRESLNKNFGFNVPLKPIKSSCTDLWYTHDQSSCDQSHDDQIEGPAFDVSKAFNIETDWWQSELTLLNAPSEPNPDLSAETVALSCIRSLQWVDHPTESHGLKYCFDFMTYGCREVVTGRRGGKNVDNFIEYGFFSPALQPFMGASRVELGELTYTPAKAPLRGALASFPVNIYGAPVLAVQHPSGMSRNGIAEPPVTRMVLRLEQQRRPPNQDCWLITEILDVRMAFAGDMGNAHVGA